MNFSKCPLFKSKANLLLCSYPQYEDLEQLKEATLLITLLPQEELNALGIENIKQKWGKAWLHFPIEDFNVPDSAFETKWLKAKPLIHSLLEKDESIAIHCRAGLGRTGTIAAKILVERGFKPLDAIQWVRKYRIGAIENSKQEHYILSLDKI